MTVLLKIYKHYKQFVYSGCVYHYYLKTFLIVQVQKCIQTKKTNIHKTDFNNVGTIPSVTNVCSIMHKNQNQLPLHVIKMIIW